MDSAFDINFVFPVSKSDEVVIFFDFLNLHLSIGFKAWLKMTFPESPQLKIQCTTHTILEILYRNNK